MVLKHVQLEHPEETRPVERRNGIPRNRFIQSIDCVTLELLSVSDWLNQWGGWKQYGRLGVRVQRVPVKTLERKSEEFFSIQFIMSSHFS